MSARPERPVALVTGAGSGIGRCVAAQLHRSGDHVVLLDRDRVALSEALAELMPTGRERLHAFEVDVADAASVASCVATIESEVGPITKLALVAGVLRVGSAISVSEDDWKACLAINAGGVFHVARAASAAMIARRTGAVVTVSSNAGRTPRLDLAAYAASKAAATMFTKCLGLELAAYGIRCNVVAPGSTHTPMLRALWEQSSGATATLEGDLRRHRLGIPLGRIADAEDVANLVRFLLSDEARHITLQEICVDGGSTL